jgi:seryl-tRNA(Sec) selenium transferase
MAAASKHYVQLDELADAIGKRLGELTGAEFGLVTNGCSAGLTHATAACVAGGNPDLHVRIPNLQGFPKDEAIIPKHSRNVYDAAVRAVGVKIIEVETVEQFEAALGPRTALIYVLAGPNADKSALPVKVMAPLAKAKNVPILVDAAAEILTVPNVHLQDGATLVGYSGGKCLRGPQAGGLLLGRKDLIKAAWVHSAPHHGYSRGFKVGKEEAIGILMAVEMWSKRDHEAETKKWNGWLDEIATKVKTVPGVTTVVSQPEVLSNKTPSLRIIWDRTKIPLAGDQAAKALDAGEPRITLVPARGGDSPDSTGISVTPYMMAEGDSKIIAEKVHALLSKPPAQPPTPPPAAPATDLTGTWVVKIQYAASSSTHALHLAQKGGDVMGSHQGDFTSRDVMGKIDGDTVTIRSAQGEQTGDSLNYSFTGKVAKNGSDEQMSGTLEMGEYLGATWTATRKMARRRG